MAVLVGIEEVLVRLRDRGPRTTSAIAHEFGLNPLDARILLLDAHLHGLVIRNDWGEWAISERGREALAAGPDKPLGSQRRVRGTGPTTVRVGAAAWGRAPRRAILVSAGAAVCGLVLGVAIGLANNGGGPAQPPANQQAVVFVNGHRRVLVGAGRHGGRGLARAESRLVERAEAGREARSVSRAIVRRTLPTTILAARVARATANVAGSPTSLRMSANRAFRAKGSCTATSKSSGHRTGARQHGTSTRCTPLSRTNRTNTSN